MTALLDRLEELEAKSKRARKALYAARGRGLGSSELTPYIGNAHIFREEFEAAVVQASPLLIAEIRRLKGALEMAGSWLTDSEVQAKVAETLAAHEQAMEARA